MKSNVIFAALCLAVGIALVGYFVGAGIIRHNQTSKISVKGLAEREVPATIAIWTLGYTANGDQLADLNTRLGRLLNATQGWFQIEDRDEATPEKKVARVVVEAEYEIE